MTGALKAFDLTGPLPTGTTLVEASAGTGKTWTLAALVIRYVADEGRPLDELLVVTFSRLASQELRERVRAQLEVTVERLEAPPAVDDDVLVQHLRRGTHSEVTQRIRRMRAALADFDTATIATIHQFCHLVLRSLGVVGDSDPHATLVEDLTELRRDVVDDLFLARAMRAGTWADHATSTADARLALDNPGAPLLPDQAAAPVAARQDFMRDVRVEFAKRKRRAALLGYDDLLAELADALEDEDGPARTRMRQRWSVVLVDEFQDTDPIQWQVFSRAFATPGKTLVLIGDPKQAIYGFRGGDVHTYLAAARTSTTQCSLPTNHRSDAPLVDALQVLTCGAELSPGIEVHPIRAALTRDRLAGAPDNSPVRLRVVGGDRLPMDQARTLVAADTATEIAELLDAGAEYDARPLVARDVAVLARTTKDLHAVRAALRQRGVPSVLVTNESVLRTEAATWWLVLLTALEHPHRPERVRAACLTPLVGWSVPELDELGDEATERAAELVRELVMAFQRGALPGVLDVLRGDGLSARILGRVGGERDLTDVEHCAQVLQEQATAGRPSLTALVTWLLRQSAEDAESGSGTRVIRLDSDVHAVTLSTIHGSKGLQYPVVHAPFLFSNWIPSEDPMVVHRSDKRVIAFGEDRAAKADARREAQDEDMRLAYVAMTRAQSQLVLAWAPTYNTPGSGLHRLLFGRAANADQLAAFLATPPSDRTVTVLERPAKEPPAAVVAAMLTQWALAGAFSLTHVPDEVPIARVNLPQGQADALGARSFTRTIDHGWRRTSYSALASAGAAATPRAAGATEPEGEAIGSHDEEEVVVAERAGTGIRSPMAGLPIGATFGSLVHGVLEHADLQAGDLRAALRDRIVEQRARWPVDLDVDELVMALELVCATPLGTIADEVTLSDIASRDHLAEMDFELPLGGGDRAGTGSRLGGIAALMRHHLPDGDPLLPYATELESKALGDQVLRGYLTGSVDLTFRHGGRYFVVDHKTNWLGEPEAELTLDDYAPDRLAAAMTHTSYPLQAILYAVVLHRYLRWRLPGYDPAAHLGGVLYLYLRGMAGPDTPRVDGCPHGVFAWRPPVALIEDVSALLDGANARGNATETVDDH
ncbi:UvrD-helicase domain-containing protein [Knoellia sp. CPCC 206450]|uniref:UvrD-helicase domain-containing protein n=1 Tax=Knoellia tibetensis TaxID=3404798 RepID=UPI003B42B973